MTHPQAAIDLILIVDDESGNLDMLSRRLRKRGYDVVTAASVAEARRVMAEHKVDILLLDIMMPRESGLDYLQELRSQPETATIPVILVSALDQTEDVVRGLSLGANDYVAKPINFQILTARLDTQLKLGRTLKRLEHQNTVLNELAALDPLTGVYNRRMGEELFSKLIRGNVRTAHPVSVALFDIDHFKRVNDSLGHLAGDSVLKGFAQRISSYLRAGDILYRYGGEEFCAIFPETAHERGIQIAARLKDVINAEPLIHDQLEISVTVSAGLCTIVPHAESEVRDWIEAADRALYAAKSSGRNRVCSSDAVPTT